MAVTTPDPQPQGPESRGSIEATVPGDTPSGHTGTSEQPTTAPRRYFQMEMSPEEEAELLGDFDKGPDDDMGMEDRKDKEDKKLKWTLSRSFIKYCCCYLP
ncbi:hypothetical protein ACI65C_004634 [Semiaphis heraclei]